MTQRPILLAALLAACGGGSGGPPDPGPDGGAATDATAPDGAPPDAAPRAPTGGLPVSVPVTAVGSCTGSDTWQSLCGDMSPCTNTDALSFPDASLAFSVEPLGTPDAGLHLHATQCLMSGWGCGLDAVYLPTDDTGFHSTSAAMSFNGNGPIDGTLSATAMDGGVQLVFIGSGVIPGGTGAYPGETLALGCTWQVSP